MVWVDLASEAELAAKGKLLLRHEGRQILLLRTGRGVFAVANRCPHEGYPLSEGTLGDGCVLTCNWHNWKFDLASGATLVGGDPLRSWPVRLEDGRVSIDVVPEDPQERRKAILSGIEAALDERDQQRLLRETARLNRLGLDPVDGVRHAVLWSAPLLQYGMSHAHAAAVDWLALHDRPETGPDEKLAALGEILGHLADDARGGRLFPFAQGHAAWDAAALLAAIEREDEAAAIRVLRGGLALGMTAGDFLPVFVRAALAPYADFGHSLIYAVKAVDLARRLAAPDATEAIFAALIRSLVYATREDLLPEFRSYTTSLAQWGDAAEPTPSLDAVALRRKSPKAAMALVAAWGRDHASERIFAVLVEAAAWTMGHADPVTLTRVDVGIDGDIGWLDFTHALTFAEAGLSAVAAAPDLWPALLLQLACFVGRNQGYVDPAFDLDAFAVADPEAFLARETRGLFDHGRGRFIISAHLIKTLMAGAELARRLPAAAPVLFAALNRFLHTPIQERRTLRVAHQMRAFVEAE
jgi:nitrite reductase/ring-hydroxylating ferredoxin subunit